MVYADQEPTNTLNSLIEDDLSSARPSSDVVLRELEEFSRQHPQAPNPHNGNDEPSDSA